MTDSAKHTGLPGRTAGGWLSTSWVTAALAAATMTAAFLPSTPGTGQALAQKLAPQDAAAIQPADGDFAPGTLIKVPAQAQPTLALEDVRVGMTGYGRTIFNGTKIESFKVKVVAVIPDTDPKRGTFWIVCDHPRLDLSGPVQGMSGSPIYLWPDSQNDAPGSDAPERTLGEGGVLAGAFAFGYGGVRECLAGVQPIQWMRQVGDRVRDVDGETASGHSQPTQATLASQQAGHDRRTLVHQLTELARHAAPNSQAQQKAIALAKGLQPSHNTNTVSQAVTTTSGNAGNQAADLFDFNSGLANLAPVPNASWGLAEHWAIEPTTRLPQHAEALALPINVGDPTVAASIQPLLNTFGSHLVATAGNGSASTFAGGASGGPSLMGAQPHADIDPSQVFLEPGSALCVPFAWGDMNLAGNGTVTDVLPDGTVLAFGHAMDGLGDTTLPMANGYVHFVVPSREISFRQAGALSVQGSVLRDENSAIAGNAHVAFASAPVTVHVNIEGQPVRDYHFRVLEHPNMTAPIAATVVANSLSAVQNMPLFNTATFKMDAEFSNGQSFHDQAVLPMVEAGGIAQNMLPYLQAVLSNPFEPVSLKSLEATIDIVAQDQSAQLLEAWVDAAQHQPGDTVTVHVKLQPYRGDIIETDLSLTLPDNLPPGMHQLAVVDRMGWTSLMMRSQPSVMNIESLDDMFTVIRKLSEPLDHRLHLVLPVPGNHIATRNHTYTDLPTSRLAMVMAGADSTMMPVPKLLHAETETKHVAIGQLTVPIEVIAPHLPENAAPGAPGRRRM